LGWLDDRGVWGRIMSCGVQGGTLEWVQIQHCDHGFGVGRGKYSGRWGKVSQNVISVYFGYAMNVLNGQMPYIDFSVEYPFMFLIPVLIPLIPAMIANDANVYVAGFQVLMAFFDILTLFLVYLIGLRIFDSKRAFRAALLYATAFAASYFILTKYDSFPTFLLVLGTFAAVYGMPARSYISTILGFFTKVFPVIAVPYLVPFNASKTSLKTEIVTLLKVAAVCGAIFLIPMILLVQDWYRPFLFATERVLGYMPIP
jgi:hypothetical protein